MTASTFFVVEAEARGTLVDGFLSDAQDFTKGKNGTLKASVPYFQRPGEERTCTGAGGVLTSARDLVRFFKVSLDLYFMVILGGLDFDVVEQRSSPVHERDHYPGRSC